MTIRKLEMAVVLVVGLGWGAAAAQKTIPEPATDSAVQSSPIQAAPQAAAVDGSVQASPITDEHHGHGGVAIPAHTAIPIALGRAIDSGRLKNGDNVAATLRAPITLRGARIPAGTAVELSVIATVPAGKLGAAGEFSLQLLRVGHTDVYTDTLTFRGKVGHKDVADSAPDLGTDAGLARGAALTFHVLPAPTAAENTPPKGKGKTPGSVDGVASGSAPPAGAVGSMYKSNNPAGQTAGNKSQNGNQAQQPVAGSNTTSRPLPGSSPSPAATQPR